MTTAPDWASAACRDHDPELWFRDDTPDIAADVCSTCPIATACLTYAQTNRIGFGVWGGQDPQARARNLGIRTRDLTNHPRARTCSRDGCNAAARTGRGNRTDGPSYCSRACSRTAWEVAHRDDRRARDLLRDQSGKGLRTHTTTRETA